MKKLDYSETHLERAIRESYNKAIDDAIEEVKKLFNTKEDFSPSYYTGVGYAVEKLEQLKEKK